MNDGLSLDAHIRWLAAWLSFLGMGVAGCELEVDDGDLGGEDDGDLIIGYEASRVVDSDGAVVLGGDSPGGHYTAYNDPPGYPLRIEVTAYPEGPEGRASPATASLDLAPDATCAVDKSPVCDGDTCELSLEMPEDGVCIASLTLTDTQGRRATDCWGFGWTDGRELNDEEADGRTDDMISQRDDYCE